MWMLTLLNQYPFFSVAQYYEGVVHAGEYARLVREPTNPYDRNAIRMENMRFMKVLQGCPNV
jgi:hypothetical protein